MGRIRSCLGRIGCLTLLVLGTTFGWLYRREIADWWLERTGGVVALAGSSAGSDSAAARPGSVSGRPAGGDTAVEDRSSSAEPEEGGRAGGASRETGSARRPAGVEAFLAAPLPATLRMDGEELGRLVRDRIVPGLPAEVTHPAAVPEDSALRVEADVDVRRLVGDRLPAMLRRMVGDSARVRALVSPSVPRRGTLRLEVRELRAGSVGLPVMAYPWLLTEMGLPLAPDDPRAVELPVGYDLTAARVEDGILVLERRAP